MSAKLIKGTEIREEILEEVTKEVAELKEKNREGSRSGDHSGRRKPGLHFLCNPQDQNRSQGGIPRSAGQPVPLTSVKKISWP